MLRTGRWTVVAMAALTACGGDNADVVVATPVSSPSPTAETSLTITTDIGDGSAAQESTLICDPPGGTHPDPAGACEALAALDPKVFDPVPSDQACTMIFGGPETATINGIWNSVHIDASFSQQNGCEITRWEAVTPLLGAT